MSDLDLETELTKLERFLKKEDRLDFVNEVRSLDLTKLDAKLLGLSKHREEIVTGRDQDNDLRNAKAHARDLGATYRKQLKVNEKMARFIALHMKDQGLV